MTNSHSTTINLDKIWFGLLAIYIIMGYIAQDTLLSSSLSSLSLYVFLAFSVFTVLQKGKVRISSLILWAIAFLFVSFLSTIYSPEFLNFDGAFYSMIVNFVLVFIFTQMPWTQERFRFILSIYVASSFILMIALALTGNLGDTSATGRLGQDLMGNSNILAMMLMVCAIYAIWLLLSSKTRFTKIAYFVALIVIYFGMILSGGRKFVIVPIIFLYIVLLLKSDEKGRKHVLRSTLLFTIILYVFFQIIMNVPFFYESIGQRFEGFFSIFIDGNGVDSSTEKRMIMIEAASQKWIEHPFFGAGFDSFKYYNQAHVTRLLMYSHNNFLELLYNQGLLGFGVYYSFYGYLLAKAIKNRKKSLGCIFTIALIISLLSFEYFGVTYESTPTQIMLFFCWYNMNAKNIENSIDTN